MGLTTVEGNDRLERIQSIIGGFIFAIFFFSVVLYTGFRGYQAYNSNPSTVQNFQPNATVTFPAVTFCPFHQAIVLNPNGCVFETAGNVVSQCTSTVYRRQVTLVGLQVNCWTFNEPQDGSAPLIATSTSDEIAVSVAVDTTTVLPGEPYGALVMLHAQGLQPSYDQYSFLADVGGATEVLARASTYVTLNSTVTKSFQNTATTSRQAPVNNGDSTTVQSVDIQFSAMGVYNTQEVRFFDPDAWIGEVGGLVCLLMLLHKVLVWLFMIVPRWNAPGPARSNNDGRLGLATDETHI